MSTRGTVVIRQSVRIVACKVQHVSEYPVMIMAAVHVMTMSRRKTLVAILSSDVQVNQHFEPSLANVLLLKRYFFIGAPYYIIRIYKFDG